MFFYLERALHHHFLAFLVPSCSYVLNKVSMFCQTIPILIRLILSDFLGYAEYTDIILSMVCHIAGQRYEEPFHKPCLTNQWNWWQVSGLRFDLSFVVAFVFILILCKWFIMSQLFLLYCSRFLHFIFYSFCSVSHKPFCFVVL